MNATNPLILALPKGRVFEDFSPLLQETDFALRDDPKKSRKMLLDTQSEYVKVLIVRGWDIPTYITSGAAHLGVVGRIYSWKRMRMSLSSCWTWVREVQIIFSWTKFYSFWFE